MLLHTSTDQALKENWKPGAGRFGSALFFVNGDSKSDAYRMSSVATTVYALTDDAQDKLNIAERYELDIADELRAILDDEEPEHISDIEDDYERECARVEYFNSIDADAKWDAQAGLLALAVEQGFDGVIDNDEQGTVYILSGDSIVSKLIKL
jgi:hypothetical protein